MSVKNFIPEITSAEVEVAYHNATVIERTLVARPDSEIASGNAVTVIGAELPTVQDYAAQGRKFTAEEIEASEVKILIDQEKVVPQRVDNIDKRQAAGELSQFTDLQGPAHAKDSEAFILKRMIDEGSSINVVGSTPVTIDSAVKAKAALRKIAAAMDAAEVPEEGRYAAINPAFKELLVEGLSDAAQSGSTDALIKNKVTELYGLTVIWTANFAEKTKPVAVGYHERAAALVRQISEVRAVQATDGHADIVSTLHVYGGKVTRPAGVVVYVSGGTAAPVAG